MQLAKRYLVQVSDDDSSSLPVTQQGPPKKQRIDSNKAEGGNVDIVRHLPPHPSDVREAKEAKELTDEETEIRKTQVCCQCPGAVKAAFFTVKKEGPTQGKTFYKCGTRNPADQCSAKGRSGYFFIWEDEIGPACPEESCGCTWSIRDKFKKREFECGLCNEVFVK